jgi:hypothetical protein
MNTKKAIGIFLIFAFVISIVTSVQISPVNAQAAVTQKTYAIVDAIPNPTGVGEATLLKYGVTQALGSANLQWTGITLTIVKPDGTTETRGPFNTDSTGSSFDLWTPTEAGNYTITTNFPNNTNTVGFFDYERNAFIAPGTILLASSKTMTLEVTEEPLLAYPGHALPTEYWSRPIDPQLREWYTVSGNWVTRPDNSIALYNDDAPETAHVLWSTPLTTGGLAGGLLGDGQVPAGSETGDAYEGKFSNSVVLNGVLYYNLYDIGNTNKIVAQDLHTGEILWVKNDTTLSFGQVLYFNSYNYDGVFTYLYSVSGSTYTAWDPFDGKWCFTFTNVPSGTTARGPSGEILIYVMDYTNHRMALWNSTQAGLSASAVGTPSFGSWGSQVQGKTMSVNTRGCFSYNVSIGSTLNAGLSFFSPILKVYDDRVVSVLFNQTMVRVWGIDTHGLTSTSTSAPTLFDQTWAAPSEWLAGSNTLHYVGATNYVEGGVIGMWDKELTTHYGFSVETGQYLWQTESEHYLDLYGWGNAEHTWYYAYGKLYSVGVGGIVYAYDLATGNTDWTYVMDDLYNEPVTGQNWWGWINLIADGKIYVGTLEHSAENPMPRGGPYICINATDGSEIWRVNGMYRSTRWGGNSVMGDSIIGTMDTYDQQLYAIGKGPTALTVEASPKVSVQSSSVLIEGMVTDTSPGTNEYIMKARFPNGVPAVSDASQSQWMLYVYKQFERPSDATGVQVTIDVLDSNGNFRNIGTTTSDSMGAFSLSWVPDISGKYTVFATFAGSKAYYASAAETAFVVDAAPEATAAPTAIPPSVSEQYFVPMSVGILVAIIVIGAVLALLLLRKK